MQKDPEEGGSVGGSRYCSQACVVESQRAISHIRWSRQHGQGSSSCRFLNAVVRISIFILRATRSSIQSPECSPLHYGGALLNGIREACQNFTGMFTRDKVRWPCIQPKDQFPCNSQWKVNLIICLFEVQRILPDLNQQCVI